MGYAAIVRCNCYRDGLTTEPPHKEYVQVDEEGVYINLDELGLTKTTRLAWYLEFDSWQMKACIHPDMHYAYEHLQNISGMANFRSTLAKLNAPRRFQALNQYLPVANSGALPIEHAATALQEINALSMEYIMAFESTKLVQVGIRHAYILDALRRVLTASLETNNPVIWI
ncbi:hypothetical protein [Hymenobacter sp. YC55]|uniref:hypothetical protein n=1 Tax=Hymenobacter sp. YC55 TaxID=3034019 RepID=UPI0023F79EA7|nr:hypothetical protein [Hymenobacter sp. YC55]MDF7810266.1 hypothetical protein [Hymenobacter sp. YC55]